MGNIVTLEGRNTALDAISSGKKIKRIFIAKESGEDQKIKEIIDHAKKKNIQINFIPSKELHNKSQTSNAQSVLVEMDIEPVSLKEILNKKENPLILLFNRLDYEQNLGAILRVAWGAGVDAIVVNPHGVSEITPVVAKVSMGGAAYVPLISESLFQSLTLIKDAGIPVVGVESGMGEIYTEQNLIGPVAFVFGGEDSGVSEPLKKYCDVFIHIPMHSDLSSLNVSVATAIVLFEKLRQDREK